MSKRNILFIVALVGLVAVGSTFWPLQGIIAAEHTMEENSEASEVLNIALDFVKSSPTFAFDGIEDTLTVESVHVLESYPLQYRITVAFDSSQGGYGDREGQFLTQVITPHKMDLLISDGTVMSAITDGRWDEIHGRFLQSPDLDGVIGFPQLNAPINLGFDSDVFVESEDLHVILEDIQDSRCPADVVCVHQGDVKVTVHVIHNEQSLGGYTLTTESNGKSQSLSVGDYLLRVLQVEPYPFSDRQIGDSEYAITMLITKLALLSPKQQVDNGVVPQDVVCDEGLLLIQKITGSAVACVLSSTAQKLVERGWAAPEYVN